MGSYFLSPALQLAGNCCSREGTGTARQQQQQLNIMTSHIRQNYQEDCEALVNKQINMELYANYVYMSMAYYFDRDDVAYSGFSSYFKKNSDEERDHGEKFIKYQNRRGGKVVFQDIAKPTTMEWGTPLEAMEAALELEKTVNQSLLDMHKAADGDAHLCDFLEANFLDEQVDAIKEISVWITKLKHTGPGLGVYLIDKEFKDFEKKLSPDEKSDSDIE